MEMDKEKRIYTSYLTGERTLYAYGGMIPSQKIHKLTNTTKNIREGAYIYLDSINVVARMGLDVTKLEGLLYFNMSDIYPLLDKKNKIYTNGGSDILWS